MPHKGVFHVLGGLRKLRAPIEDIQLLKWCAGGELAVIKCCEHPPQDIQFIFDHRHRLLYGLHGVGIHLAHGIAFQGFVHIVLDADIVRHKHISIPTYYMLFHRAESTDVHLEAPCGANPPRGLRYALICR